MGKIIANLHSGRQPEEIFLDFENAKPSEEEKDIYQKIGDVLKKGPEILEELFKYSGCESLIRQAITTPTPENEETAWTAVVPAVDKLQEFYAFSLLLQDESCFPALLIALCKEDPKNSLGSQQALAKQLAEVFDFVLRFDDAKMVNPAIQNDFSYYRRQLNRIKLTNTQLNIKVRDDLANKMSLFFAYPTPMMKVLSDTTANFLKNHEGQPGFDANLKDQICAALSTMANACQSMVHNKKFEADTTNMFCLRAMTGAIVLYDHISNTPGGAFARKSPVEIKGCISVLKSYTAMPTDGLLNALRFTTIHLNDQETPASTKQLLS